MGGPSQPIPSTGRKEIKLNQLNQALFVVTQDLWQEISKLLLTQPSAGFAVANGRNSRPIIGFGVYSDPATGTQVFNLGTSSERILHGGTKLKSASLINIDIDYKPRGLKWQGKDAVSISQLQQMRANKRN
ncbi:hypothetical protein RND71_022063 [Anisodus tanguticus]|uniref:Uncharacterized protein n=1 Tax=Anisodus tanguticus TaxID=243964 RepID=A0AAE1RWD0_9SOLA|nr:hypothetical protein RND71_022063 [Anisodus tanguticus]